MSQQRAIRNLSDLTPDECASLARAMQQVERGVPIKKVRAEIRAERQRLRKAEVRHGE